MRNDHDLLHGDAHDLADYLGISVRTVQMYKSGKLTMPQPVRRLLALRFEGDLGALLGDDWEGFYVHSGTLFAPGWRNGLSPHQVRGMFFTLQEVSALKAELRDLKSRIWAMQKVRDAERLGGKAARLREHAAALQRLSDLIALDVCGDSDPGDNCKRDVLDSSHSM